MLANRVVSMVRVAWLPVVLLAGVCLWQNYNNLKKAEAYFNRGNAWYEKGQYDKAIADYNEAIRLDPKDARGYNNRGSAWYAKGEYDKAIADCTEAIRLDPRDPDAYTSRGNAWRAKGEYDKAIADCSEAIRLDPRDPDAYTNRGHAWYEKGEYDKAIADYSEAIRLYPKRAETYNNRGNAWSAKGEYDKAIADYSEAIRLDPKYAPAHERLAWILATNPQDELRDGKKAVEHATIACELTGWKSWFYLDTLAVAYAEAGNFTEAVRWQKKVVQSPDIPKGVVTKVQERLQLYQEGKPYREGAGD